jgi:hypothetical protein
MVGLENQNCQYLLPSCRKQTRVMVMLKRCSPKDSLLQKIFPLIPYMYTMTLCSTKREVGSESIAATVIIPALRTIC